MSSSISCKSCSKCQEIYKILQKHIAMEHLLTGTERVISNVIINLLSLMVPLSLPEERYERKTKQQPKSCQTVPIPAIAKQPEKHTTASSESESSMGVTTSVASMRIGTAFLPSFSQEFSDVPNELQGGVNFKSEVVSNMFALPHSKL